MLMLFLLIAKKTGATGAGRKKAADVEMDSSSDFDFSDSKPSKPKKQLMPKAAPTAKTTKPKVTKAPKKTFVSSDLDSSDEEAGGKKTAPVCILYDFAYSPDSFTLMWPLLHHYSHLLVVSVLHTNGFT